MSVLDSKRSIQPNKANRPVSQAFQALHYRFDPVGNIYSIANLVLTENGQPLNGATVQRFQYDRFYRLTEAQMVSYADKNRN